MPQLNVATPGFKTAQVLIRFAMRMVILVVFALLGSIGFVRSLAALLWMSAIISVVAGVMRRDPPFDTSLTYWDEAAAYGALCCLASAFAQAPDS
jgi:hypothetical protein